MPGLLTSKHLNKRIRAVRYTNATATVWCQNIYLLNYFQILERCANPTGSKEGQRFEATPEVRIELYKALREVLDIARQVDHDEEDFNQLDRDM